LKIQQDKAMLKKHISRRKADDKTTDNRGTHCKL
jgi:hypothetical protein